MKMQRKATTICSLQDLSVLILMWNIITSEDNIKWRMWGKKKGSAASDVIQ